MGAAAAAVGGSLVGGLFGLESSRRQAGAITDAAEQSANAQTYAADRAADAAKFRPYNVYGGQGSATFDGQNATASLSPEYKALRDRYLNYGQNTAQGLNTYDPNATAHDIYSKLRSISDYQRQQDQAGLFDTLAAKGILGLSNGQGQNPYARAFFDAQNNADLQREVNSYGLGQQLADEQLARSIKASTAGAGIDQMPLELMNLGGAFGGRQSAAGAAGGQLLSNAANAGANLRYNASVAGSAGPAAFWNSMVPGISNAATAGFNKLGGLFGNSPYAEDLSQPDYSGGFY